MTGVDVMGCCMTDWMSETISDRPELDTDQKKNEYIRAKRRAAGLTSSAGEETIWETVKPAFRSAEVSH